VAAKRGDVDEAYAAAEAALATMAPGAVQHRLQCGEQIARALADAGRQARAEEVVEENIKLTESTLAGDDGRFYRSRAYALRAWLRHERGDPGAVADVARSAEIGGSCWRFVLRKDWDRLAPVVSHALADGSLDAGDAVARIAEAMPTGAALVPLTEHPSAEVRAAALGPAIATGDPGVLRRLSDLAEDPDERVAATAARALDGGLAGAPPLRIRLLGDFSVGRGTWVASDADWGRAAAAKLVRYLAIQGRVAIPEDVIWEALWPQLEPAGASRSLRVAASLARKVLALPGTEGGGIEVAGGSYSLALVDGDTIDAEAFERAAEAALDYVGPDRLRLLREARSRWHGEPLPKDRFEDWAAAWRSRLVDRYVAVLGRLATALGDAGEPHAQIDVARELVEIDPHDEAAHRLLMAAYARTGRRGQALRQYLACRRALVDGLGVEPSRETAGVHARILAGEAL
jgi:DNA-binding SARP family transcriptional activator